MPGDGYVRSLKLLDTRYEESGTDWQLTLELSGMWPTSLKTDGYD